MAEKRNILDMFLRLKALKDKREKGTIEYKNSDGDVIVLNKLSENKLMEIFENTDPETPMKELNDTLIYAAMPDLHSKEVLETFECTANPEAVVGKIFSLADRTEMANRLKAVVEETTIEDLKN